MFQTGCDKHRRRFFFFPLLGFQSITCFASRLPVSYLNDTTANASARACACMCLTLARELHAGCRLGIPFFLSCFFYVCFQKSSSTYLFHSMHTLFIVRSHIQRKVVDEFLGVVFLFRFNLVEIFGCLLSCLRMAAEQKKSNVNE